MKTNIGVSGASGSMGGAVIRAITEDANVSLSLAFEAIGHSAVGALAADGITKIRDEQALSDKKLQVLIDFTRPEATLKFAERCASLGIGMVVGTTGFSDEELVILKSYSKHIPLLLAQNMSIGVNVMYRLARFAAKHLKAGHLGGGYDIEVFEAHHRRKKDSPSGTALRLGRELAEATGGDLNSDAVLTRRGRSDESRGVGDIGFSVVRGGDIVGEHRVIFAGMGEQIEITHRSSSRANYAAGAVCAAKFIATAPSGFYDGMDAVFGSSSD